MMHLLLKIALMTRAFSPNQRQETRMYLLE